jgi:hypothetical protein
MVADAEEIDQRVQTEEQLRLLDELATIFASERIRAWLRGGWALDLLIGRVTRLHSDIDLVTWMRCRNRAHRVLSARGFRVARVLPVQTDLVKRGTWVSIVFVARDEDGRVVTPGIPQWIWRSDALPDRKRVLHGLSWRVVGPEQLLYERAELRGRHRPAAALEGSDQHRAAPEAHHDSILMPHAAAPHLSQGDDAYHGGASWPQLVAVRCMPGASTRSRTGTCGWWSRGAGCSTSWSWPSA